MYFHTLEALNKITLIHYVLDAVGSWQIILPMPNLERTSDKESEAVLRCLQYRVSHLKLT